MALNKIMIYSKPGDRTAYSFAQDLAQWLLEKNFYSLINPGLQIVSQNLPFIKFIICIGGDGTILGVCRTFAGKGIPIAGINFGKMGFLCSSNQQNWQTYLENILSGKEEICHFLALEWTIERKGKIISSGVAANDVVLSRTNLARLINIDFSINNLNMGLLRGDGIICSTPLGSSGYNISAGGALVQTGLNVFQLTPVCSFVNRVAPIILAGQTTIKWKISANSAECYLTVDGQEGAPLQIRDEIKIRGWENALTFYGNNNQYISSLQKRGFILEKSLMNT